VIFDANGWILTNRHVIADAAKLTIELKDGRQFRAPSTASTRSPTSRS
jgi:S1-C subfamily serine protease